MQRLCNVPTAWQHALRRWCSVKSPAITNTHSQFSRPGEVRKQDADCLEKILKLDLSSHVCKQQSRLQEKVPALSNVYHGAINHFKQCRNDNKDDKFKSRVCEELYSWFTGVLTIYCGKLIHKYVHTEKEKCPLYILRKETLLHAVVSKDTPVLAISNKDVFDGASANSLEHKLDEAFASFKAESDECCGAVLNKCALEYRKQNKCEKAFVLFQSAAEYGYVPSIYNMGLCYEFGHGVEVSLENAEKYYHEAADKGHVKSMFNIATFHYERDGRLEGDYNKVGFYYMKKAADKGLAQACSFVGLKYTEDQNWLEAFKYFKMAAEQHDISSFFNLAVCFENGLGTKKDVEQAMKYYRRGAEMGDGLSQFLLGDSYEHGLRGVKRDLKEALKWFELAMESGGQPESKRRVELLKGLVAKEEAEQNGLEGIFSFLDIKKCLEPRYKDPFMLSLKQHDWVDKSSILLPT